MSVGGEGQPDFNVMHKLVAGAAGAWMCAFSFSGGRNLCPHTHACLCLYGCPLVRGGMFQDPVDA